MTNSTHISDEQKQTALNNIPLFDMASHATTLRQKGNSDEYEGKCPLCGKGQDRFYIRATAKTWGCRGCSQGYNDALAFVMKLDNIGFVDAVKRYADAPVATDSHKTTIRTVAAPNEPAAPVVTKFPDDAMQPTLRDIVSKGRECLLHSEEAQTYLQERGIFDSIDKFSIGYSDGFDVGDVHVPKGIMFPHIIGGRVWGVKIRRLPSFTLYCKKCREAVSPGNKCTCKDVNNRKNIQVGWTKESGRSGGLNITALYNADSLLNAETAIVCEGEIDCITLSQELSLPVVTLGGVGNTLDVVLWGMYAATLQTVYVVKDNDIAGQKLRWADELFGAKAVNVSLPDGCKDPNDLLVKQDKLFGWAVKNLLTPGQQAKFRRAWQEAKTWNVSERGAVRLAWLHVIGKPAQSIPSGEAFQEARRVLRPALAAPVISQAAAEEPTTADAPHYPGRNHAYEPGDRFCLLRFTRRGAKEYLVNPSPMQVMAELGCAWLFDELSHAKQAAADFDGFAVYAVTVAKIDGFLRLKLGKKIER